MNGIGEERSSPDSWQRSRDGRWPCVAAMMGMPVFSGSAAVAMGGLIGHLVCSPVAGAVHGAPASVPTRRQAVARRTPSA